MSLQNTKNQFQKTKKTKAMTLIKWNDTDKLPTFHDWLDEIFSEGANQLHNKGVLHKTPAVNISETEDTYRIEVAAPGYEKTDFKVKLENHVLTVSVEKKEEKEEKTDKYSRKEFSSSSFKRSFTLPKTVNEEDIAANYEKGILLINIPKLEKSPEVSKTITIN